MPRVIRPALLCALVGGVGLIIGALLAPEQTLFSYLAAYVYVLSLALGALVFLTIVNAMNATWPVAIRRVVETATSTLPLLALLFVPIVLGLRVLYPWHAPEEIADPKLRELVTHRAAYLNTPFFLGRAALYFAVWIGLAVLLRRWSLAQAVRTDGHGAPRTAPVPPLQLKARMRALSAGGLPPLGLTLSFASYDWIMSLTPGWFSTMYGVYFFAGGFIGAIALVTLLSAGADRAGVLGPLRPSHWHALGRLQLAFVIFWAYIAYFFFFLTWIANKPEEVTWFVPRVHTSWAAVSLLLVFGHFALPFFALLPYGPKRHRAPMAAIAVWILVVHFVDVYWLVLPALHTAGVQLHWLDLAALLAVGGAVVAFAAWRARPYPLVAADPALAAALAYESK